MSAKKRLVARLEKAEYSKADERELVAILQEVQRLEELWEIADLVVPYVPIMRAVAVRARELGGSGDRANGYLAIAYLFEGDRKAAEQLSQSVTALTDDSVLLEAWAMSAGTAERQLERLTEAVARADEPARLWRQVKSVALLAGLAEKAAEAEAWLARNA
jgi:hypothetical protein